MAKENEDSTLIFIKMFCWDGDCSFCWVMVKTEQKITSRRQKTQKGYGRPTPFSSNLHAKVQYRTEREWNCLPASRLQFKDDPDHTNLHSVPSFLLFVLWGRGSKWVDNDVELNVLGCRVDILLIRDKLWSMRAHGSMLLYVHRNHKARQDGEPRTATSTFTRLIWGGE